MKTFTPTSFLAHTVAIIHETHVMQHHLLEVACKAIAHEAKNEIGHYQAASGPFPAWAPLTAATIERKGGLDNPLLRAGDLKDSIQYSVDEHSGIVGSNDPAAIYQELGTRDMPPRSFLGHAAHHLAEPIVTMVGTQYTMFLAGQSIYNRRAELLGSAWDWHNPEFLAAEEHWMFNPKPGEVGHIHEGTDWGPLIHLGEDD